MSSCRCCWLPPLLLKRPRWLPRKLSPLRPPRNTSSGAELYTVIGHAPRHLDRNIALVGRVIEGIEFLSSLPRGAGALGLYEKAEERVPIVSVRLANEMKDLPRFEYLLTESRSFALYTDARANRRDASSSAQRAQQTFAPSRFPFVRPGKRVEQSRTM